MSKLSSADLTLTLNVIVKRAILVTVSLQQLECIVVAKVFKLNQCALTKPTKTTHTMTCNYYHHYHCCYNSFSFCLPGLLLYQSYRVKQNLCDSCSRCLQNGYLLLTN